MDRKDVYAFIDKERTYQDAKWGTIQQHPHEVGSWLLIMDQLLADARQEWTRGPGDYGALDELRKVVAVGVACMEQHGAVQRT
jgi:hypothetical protein